MLDIDSIITQLQELKAGDTAVTLTAADNEKILGALQYLYYDGEHHKQYGLEQIAEVFGIQHDDEGTPA